MGKKWIRKGTVVAIIFILLVSTSAISSIQILENQNETSGRTILYVGGSGPGNYSSIQEAINDSSNADMVFVYNGTYYENIIINKHINLYGENRNNTIIDGSANTNNGITIKNHDNVTISGFTIRNVPSHPSQPSLYSNGIHIWATSSGSRHSNYNIVSNCIINNCSYHGIRIHASDNGQNVLNNLISNCEIFNNSKCGLMIASDQDSRSGSSYAKYNRIKNCSIYNNQAQGIKFGHEGETSFNIIFNCTIYNNLENGIFLPSIGSSPCTHNNTIIYCDIFNNRGYGIYIPSSYGGLSNDNKVYHNNFLNESNNAYDECYNIWDDGYPSGGNYWDDYTGNDTNGDCIGDTPYNISGGDNQDLYPFMYPNGWINNPPCRPINPFPWNDSINVPIDISLNWTGGDPDPCDTVTYDVYFGDSLPLFKRVANQTQTNYDPPLLEKGTEYYWKIVSWDNHGLFTIGDVWTFTTEGRNTPPDAPIITGETNGKPGEEYEYKFTTSDPEGDEVFFWIDWDDGDIIEWIGVIPPSYSIILDHTWKFRGTYNIRAKARDIHGAESEWGYLEVKMPKNKIFISNYPLLSWLLDRFPNIFPILRQLLVP